MYVLYSLFLIVLTRHALNLNNLVCFTEKVEDEEGLETVTGEF